MENKIYTLPDAQTIIERMSPVGSESDAGRAIRHFAAQSADRELVAHGVNLAWELAIYDIATQPGAVPMLSLMMGFQFEEYMAALIPDDAEFLAEVLAVREEMLSK